MAAVPLAALLATGACVPAQLSDVGQLLKVLATFLGLSLFSIGGGNSLLAEYHHLSVEVYCWLTPNQFTDLYALAEAAPGPSSMLVGLLGMGAAWREGVFWALLTAVLAEIAILLPSTLLVVAACLSWRRLRNSPWRIALERALGPITLGVLFAVGVKILRLSAANAPALIVSLLACGLVLRTRLSPLLMMAVAGLLGGLGVIHR
ncbi:MAG: chromate transporter [Cyanobacteriota bacterium]|nr:chromate transporter [Cyanobacteriota bacterium]